MTVQVILIITFLIFIFLITRLNFLLFKFLKETEIKKHNEHQCFLATLLQQKNLHLFKSLLNSEKESIKNNSLEHSIIQNPYSPNITSLARTSLPDKQEEQIPFLNFDIINKKTDSNLSANKIKSHKNKQAKITKKEKEALSKLLTKSS